VLEKLREGIAGEPPKAEVAPPQVAEVEQAADGSEADAQAEAPATSEGE
jgi:hypothetical protein